MSVTYGRHTYGKISLVGGGGEVKVGNFCSISNAVTAFMSQDHNHHIISTFPFDFPDFSIGNYTDGSSGKEEHMNIIRGYTVNVGNDVWLGHGCILFRGIKIGDGSVIGAFSVVAKDIPPYSIVVGNPCKILRKRFSDTDIEYLLKLKWWNKDDKTIGKLINWLKTRDVSLLKKRVEELGINV